MILELLEAKLDEGLSYLEGDGPRLARKQVRASMEFGSVSRLVTETMEESRPAPKPA